MILTLPAGIATTLDELSQAVGIQIDLMEQMPLPGTSFPTAHGWRIHVAAGLDEAQRLRTALHQLKHVIDHPVRGPGLGAELSHAEYEHLADAFADMVLGDPGSSTTPHRSSGKEESP